nr:hypothetical protein [Tanacetum cinerariifolium]
KRGFDTSITPLTTTTTPKLTAAAKGKQPAKAINLSDPSEVTRTKAQQLKIILRRSKQQTHISQPGGSVKYEDDEGVESDEGEEDADEDKDGDERDDDEENQETAKYDEQDDAEGGRDAKEEGKSDEEDNNEETKEEGSFDPIPKTPECSEDKGNGEEDQGLNVNEEEHVKEEEEDELYRDSSSVSSQFVTSMLNPTSDVGMESIFVTVSSSVAPLHTSTPIMTPSTIATITTISQAPIPPTPIPSEVLQNLPTFASVFRFDDRLKSLEDNFSEFRQTNSFVEVVFSIPSIVHQYMNQQMNEAVSVAVKIQTDRLRESYQRENDEFLQTIDENMKRIIKEDGLKKILIEKMEGNKSIQRSDEQRNLYKALVDAYEADTTILDPYGETVILKRRRDDDDDDQDEGPSTRSNWGSKRRREGKDPESASAPLETATRSAGRSTTGSKPQQASASESAFVEEPVQTTSQIEEPSHPVFEIAVQGSTQTWISDLEKQDNSRSSFNELLDTLLDFSNFIMNRLRVDTLTPEILAGPTFELMKGSCTSQIELEYHLKEVYKATTDQLDWVNPEGQQYPHNLLQPLSLIPGNRCRRVTPFAYFINNDLEYLRGSAFSRKYTTSVTTTKAVDYGQIKWIEDLFYRFAVKRESALDVYSKRRIIAVTDLKIVEWHSYKHLDWITVRRDNDKLYKFKEGDFKRLRLQDIEDILLLLRRVEDLQVGVESYQKRLNLTNPDTYRSDLKRREAYTAYSNPRGFIYQNKDKKNRLMRIDELYKFSDGTLNDVRTTLDDLLKGTRMQYLPQTIWRKGDKDRAAAMI